MRLNRRQAIAGLGSVSVGALLAACSGDDDSPTAEVETSEGTHLDRGAEGFVERPRLALRGTRPPVRRPPSRPRVRSTSTSTGSAATSARTARAPRSRLGVRVRDAAACEPIANAVVDVWHCDAAGGYSGFEGEDGETYLRGAQVTNRDGIAEFTTIYPGWYQGRTVHIHAKVHLDRRTVLTTQFYFGDEVSTKVFKDDAYGSAAGRDALNDSDGLYDSNLELTLSDEGDAYLGLITLDVASA